MSSVSLHHSFTTPPYSSRRTDFQGGNDMNRISKWTAAVMTGLMISTACLAQDAKSAKKLPEAEIVAALKKELAAQAAADEFSGVVLLAKDGKPLFRQAYGMADLGLKVPNNPETKFN